MHVAEWLEEFRSWTGNSSCRLLSALTRAAAVRGLSRACTWAGVTCVADGHTEGPWVALDILCLNLFDHLHVSASVSAPLTNTPPA